MARSLVKSMLREGNTDYAQKIMRSVFITNIFTQEDGDVFKEEVVFMDLCYCRLYHLCLLLLVMKSQLLLLRLLNVESGRKLH